MARKCAVCGFDEAEEVIRAEKQYVPMEFFEVGGNFHRTDEEGNAYIDLFACPQCGTIKTNVDSTAVSKGEQNERYAETRDEGDEGSVYEREVQLIGEELCRGTQVNFGAAKKVVGNVEWSFGCSS